MGMERCRACIDMHAATENYLYIRHRIKPYTKLLCVVKANAYGHGAVEMARLWESLGVDMLAVATAEEALLLRCSGIATPILILGYASPAMAEAFRDTHIIPTIYSLSDARQWNDAAQRADFTLPCHIKINTGMNRLGISCDDTTSIKALCALPRLFPCGIYSHLSAADTDKCAAYRQFRRFKQAACIAEGICGHTLLQHFANTEALLRYPDMHADMVRAGIGLYGYTTYPEATLLPVMRLEARVIQINALSRGETVGYGNNYCARKAMRVATLAIGYADGIRRDSGSRGVRVDIGNTRCPIIGQVCMDMCMVDVSNTDSVHVGNTAVIFDKSRGADVMAKALGTIPYEILTGISSRVKRICLL